MSRVEALAQSLFLLIWFIIALYEYVHLFKICIIFLVFFSLFLILKELIMILEWNTISKTESTWRVVIFLLYRYKNVSWTVCFIKTVLKDFLSINWSVLNFVQFRTVNEFERKKRDLFLLSKNKNIVVIDPGSSKRRKKNRKLIQVNGTFPHELQSYMQNLIY